MTKRKDLLLKITLTAIFSAVVFGLTFVNVPLPTGAKVHLGNFACVLAGLLLGPIVGGVSGSLGMGLNDIASGYSWDTFLRTFIVKFLLGFVVGLLFKILIKKDKATRITLYSLTGVFFIGFVGSLILYIVSPEYVSKGEVVPFTKGITVSLFGVEKVASLSILVPIFLGVFFLILAGLIFFLAILVKKNKERERVYLAVSTVTAISVIVNTLGEFFLRWLFKGIALSSSEAALVDSITKLPSNLITGVVTILFVTIIYLPVYLALHYAGFDKYIIHPELKEIEDNNEEVKEEINELEKNEA